jgi:hypothetical protein
MFKNLKKAWARVQRIDMLTPTTLENALSEEVELLRKERVRAVSKMHRAMCDVAFYDNLLEQLEDEQQTGHRNGWMYETAAS